MIDDKSPYRSLGLAAEPERVQNPNERERLFTLAMHKTRKLRARVGAVITVFAAIQGVLYAVCSQAPDRYIGKLFYFDPRVGVAALTDNGWPSPLEWFTVIWLVCLGIFLLRGTNVVWVYLVSEVVMTGWTLVFFGIVWRANLTAAHGFSRQELLFPAITLLVFSGVPLALAVTAIVRARASVAH